MVAAAALDRLGLADARDRAPRSPSTLLPQVGQGGLAVECREDDAETFAALTEIDDADAHAEIRAERAFLAQLGGGCSLPCGALARRAARRVARLDALLASLDGRIVLRAQQLRIGSGGARSVGRSRPARRAGRARLVLEADLPGRPGRRMTVYLVGAGPGDPGLLTRRGAALLEQADVVVYDRLAHPSLVDLAPKTAERINVGKAPGAVEMDQDGINAVLVDRGAAGKTVVRLKGGDPFVFGRGGEEAEALAAAGGGRSRSCPASRARSRRRRTRGSRSPTAASRPTSRSSPVTRIPAKGTTDTDWAALARAGGTLVILMGAGHLADIVARLIEGGRAPDTPVAAVRWGTLPAQRTIRATLATIADAGVRAAERDRRRPGCRAGPRLVRVASALRPHRRDHPRPRAGERVAGPARAPRGRGPRAADDRARADGLQRSPISRATAGSSSRPPTASTRCSTAGWPRAGLDARALAGLRVAAIGPGTAAALGAAASAPTSSPNGSSRSRSSKRSRIPPARGERVLLARAEQARDVLPDGLEERGYTVDVLAVYRTVRAVPGARASSSGSAPGRSTRSRSRRRPRSRLLRPRRPAPGSRTRWSSRSARSPSQTANERGIRVDVEADPHSIDGLVDALLATAPGGGATPASTHR